MAAARDYQLANQGSQLKKVSVSAHRLSGFEHPGYDHRPPRLVQAGFGYGIDIVTTPSSVFRVIAYPIIYRQE